jgi:hypothetical protein
MALGDLERSIPLSLKLMAVFRIIGKWCFFAESVMQLLSYLFLKHGRKLCKKINAFWRLGIVVSSTPVAEETGAMYT